MTGSRVVPRRNPLRTVFSAGPWAAVGYLVSYLVTGPPLFVLSLVTLLVGGVLGLVFWVAAPLLALIPLAWRGFAAVERRRLRAVDRTRYPTPFRTADADTLRGRVRQRWADPATGRSAVYLLVLWPFLFVLDVVAFVGWVVAAAGMTVPFWYWAPRQTFDVGGSAHGLAFGAFPHGPHGAGAHGFWVGSLSAALVAAIVSAALFVLACYLVELAALAHARAARTLLTPYDPLADARAVLEGPGPLPAYPPVVRTG